MSALTARQHPVSLGDALRGHSNSLGLLRLVLASVVIFHHSFPLGGFGPDPLLALTHQQATLGSLAVAGFFAISGYLITKSGMNADILQFMWRRSLRIFPAFWGVLLFAALVVGPTIWVLDGHDLAAYFSFGGGSPFSYLRANWDLSIGSYGIRDIFTDSTPYGQEVDASVLNGSIWTLIYEWTCYLLIGVAVLFGVLARAKVIVPIFTALLLALQTLLLVDAAVFASIFPFLDPVLVHLALTFMCGAVLAVYSKRVPFSDVLGVVAGAVVLLTLAFGGFHVLGVPAAAYLVLFLGARIGGRLQVVGAKNDYSYGVYVYGFLVQQVLAYFGVYRWGYLPFALLALVATFGLAWLSWHFVEKRAMSLKDWGPGKGWRHWFARASEWASRRRPRPAAVDAITPETADESV